MKTVEKAHRGYYWLMEAAKLSNFLKILQDFEMKLKSWFEPFKCHWSYGNKHPSR